MISSQNSRSASSTQLIGAHRPQASALGAALLSPSTSSSWRIARRRELSVTPIPEDPNDAPTLYRVSCDDALWSGLPRLVRLYVKGGAVCGALGGLLRASTHFCAKSITGEWAFFLEDEYVYDDAVPEYYGSDSTYAYADYEDYADTTRSSPPSALLASPPLLALPSPLPPPPPPSPSPPQPSSSSPSTLSPPSAGRGEKRFDQPEEKAALAAPIALVGVVILLLCVCMLILCCIFRRHVRGARRARLRAQRLQMHKEALDDVLELMLRAKQPENTDDATALALLKQIVNQASTRGQSMKTVCQQLLTARRNSLPLSVAAALDAHMDANGGGGGHVVAHTEEERVQLLKELLANGTASSTSASSMPDARCSAGAATVPPAVLSAAFAYFESVHGRAAVTDAEALAELRRANAEFLAKSPSQRELAHAAGGDSIEGAHASAVVAEMNQQSRNVLTPAQLRRIAAELGALLGMPSDEAGNRAHSEPGQLALLKQLLDGKSKSVSAAEHDGDEAHDNALVPANMTVIAREAYEQLFGFPPSNDAEALQLVRASLDHAHSQNATQQQAVDPRTQILLQAAAAFSTGVEGDVASTQTQLLQLQKSLDAALGGGESAGTALPPQLRQALLNEFQKRNGEGEGSAIPTDAELRSYALSMIDDFSRTDPKMRAAGHRLEFGKSGGNGVDGGRRLGLREEQTAVESTDLGFNAPVQIDNRMTLTENADFTTHTQLASEVQTRN
eukprot:6190368-Pleurochrysis_carterae.AAC.1